jgi:TM2 domain-containing membrane protein YozV
MAQQAIDKTTGHVLGILVEERDNSYEVRDPSGEMLSYFKEDVKLQKIADPISAHFPDDNVNAPIRQMRDKLSYGGERAAKQSPAIAGLLSFSFPGLGQFYNAKWRKGAVLLFVCVMLPMVNIFAWIWGIFDAVSDARKINDGMLPEPQYGPGGFIFIALIPLVVIFAVISMVLYIFSAGAL